MFKIHTDSNIIQFHQCSDGRVDKVLDLGAADPGSNPGHVNPTFKAFFFYRNTDNIFYGKLFDTIKPLNIIKPKSV